MPEPTPTPIRTWRDIAYELIRERNQTKVVALRNELTQAVNEGGPDEIDESDVEDQRKLA